MFIFRKCKSCIYNYNFILILKCSHILSYFFNSPKRNDIYLFLFLSIFIFYIGRINFFRYKFRTCRFIQIFIITVKCSILNIRFYSGYISIFRKISFKRIICFFISFFPDFFRHLITSFSLFIFYFLFFFSDHYFEQLRYFVHSDYSVNSGYFGYSAAVFLLLQQLRHFFLPCQVPCIFQ